MDSYLFICYPYKRASLYEPVWREHVDQGGDDGLDVGRRHGAAGVHGAQAQHFDDVVGAVLGEELCDSRGQGAPGVAATGHLARMTLISSITKNLTKSCLKVVALLTFNLFRYFAVLLNVLLYETTSQHLHLPKTRLSGFLLESILTKRQQTSLIP